MTASARPGASSSLTACLALAFAIGLPGLAAPAHAADNPHLSLREGGAVGQWIARGGTCDRSGLPADGALLFVRRVEHRGRPALLTYGDEIYDGQLGGIESEACTLFDLTPAGRRGLFTGRFQCTTEGVDERGGTLRLEIGRNPGERAPFLAIRMDGRLERYTRCR